MVHTHDSVIDKVPMPANSLPPGTRLYEYEIQSVLGEGGFGIVYLARDTMLDRDVAIKEFLPISHAVRYDQHQVRARTPDQQALFDKGMQSFVAEARILAQFRNPSLVEVLRFWEGNGTAYLVMPYYQGRTLRELIQKGYRATSKAELLNILLPLMHGLEQVHGVGCFHRDISPDNILILPDGAPLLLDFGAARHEIINQAEYSTVILKPGFAPIEQYGGRETAAQQGAWTDVYALCAVAYQMITGTTPPASVARIMRDPMVLLSNQAEHLAFPRSVLEAIDAGLQIQPEDRPQSISTLRELFKREAAHRQTVSDADRVQQHPLGSVAAGAGSAAGSTAAIAGAASAVDAAAAASGAQNPEALPTAQHPLPTLVSAEKDRHGSRWPMWLGLLVFLLVLGVGIWFLLFRPGGEAGTPQPPSQQAPSVPMVAPPQVGLQDGAAVSQPVIAQEATMPETQPLESQGVPGLSLGEEAVTIDALGTPFESSAMEQDSAVGGPELAGNDQLGGGETVVEQQELEAAVQEEQEPEAPLPTTGKIVVEARPWGDVYVNGALIGTAPPRVTVDVPPGAATVEVRNDSAQSHSQTVEVRIGQTVRVSHDFTR